MLEQGRLFEDPLAVAMLGPDADLAIANAREHPASRRMRMFIAARSRFAEDALETAIEGGVTQAVILGAGLDTYAYRGRLRHRVRIFEVDHPATQAWKRQRLEESAIAIPEALTFAPVDFERQTLSQELGAAGFAPGEPAFFVWLGVIPYLTQEAIFSTLRYVAHHPAGAHIVFDYGDPPASLPDAARERHELRARRVAELGEPWLTYFTPPLLFSHLTELGFTEIEDLNPRDIAARYFPSRMDALPEQGGHLVHATTQRNR